MVTQIRPCMGLRLHKIWLGIQSHFFCSQLVLLPISQVSWLSLESIKHIGICRIRITHCNEQKQSNQKQLLQLNKNKKKVDSSCVDHSLPSSLSDWSHLAPIRWSKPKWSRFWSSTFRHIFRWQANQICRRSNRRRRMHSNPLCI